jgi:DNA polymerase-1
MDDIHRQTAAAIFKCDPAQVSAEQRRAGRTINFGLLWGRRFSLEDILNAKKQ